MIGKAPIEKALGWLSRQKDIRRGQISLESELGTWIAFISSLTTIRTIVDIGTWSGAGSTLCIASGVNKRAREFRHNVKVLGFEIDPEMSRIATKNLERFKSIQVVHGSIVSDSQLDRENLSPDEEIWLEQDLKRLASAPNVLELVPEKLDLLVLDGGEFSSHAEYLTLKSRLVGWVVLDDTNVRKNRSVLSDLAADAQFVCVWKTAERNGAAIFVKKDWHAKG